VLVAIQTDTDVLAVETIEAAMDGIDVDDLVLATDPGVTCVK
jgi:hypothetical protein